jgi:predicted RNA-binding protein with PIN domain
MPENPKYLLVDGHSVLFQVDSLRSQHEQNRQKARECLMHSLQLVHDTSDWLITVVFDGTRSAAEKPRKAEPGKIAVLYGTRDTTADSIIEKIVANHPSPQSITVVTGDQMEARTVEALGALVLSPEWLIREIDSQSGDFQATLRQINRKAQW